MNENPYAPPEFVSEPVPPVKRGFRWYVVGPTALGIIVVGFALLAPATRNAREPARRTQCKNNLKQIGLALANYQDDWHSLPPAYTVDAGGRPLHSWRTLILPYVDKADLYQKIDLSKPWNDPANLEAFNTSIGVYHCSRISLPRNHTTYLAVVTQDSCLRAGESCKLPVANPECVMIIETDSTHAVHWMAPTDANEALLMSLGPKETYAHAGGVYTALANGSVWFLTADTPADVRRRLISISAESYLTR